MFQINSAIQRCNQELNLVGQLVTDQDFILYAHRANRYYNTHYKMPTSQRTQDYLLFTGVYEYAIPTDMLAPIDWTRPYDEFTPKFDHYAQTPFAQFRTGNIDSVKFEKETQTLLVNLTGGTTSLINSMDDTDGWSVSGTGSGLAQDKQYYVQGTASLKALVTPGTFNFTKSDLDSFDVSEYIDAGFVFLSVYNPSSTPITSITIKWGSDASNYYQITSTTPYKGGTLGQGFNQVDFDLSTKSTVGTPNNVAMTYVDIAVVCTVGGTFRLDNLFIALPYYFQLPYYSVYNVKTAAGAYIEIPTQTSDYILCPPGFDEAYEYKMLEYASIEKLEDNGLANYFRNEMRLKENKLKQQYPRLDTLKQTNWYRSSVRF